MNIYIEQHQLRAIDTTLRNAANDTGFKFLYAIYVAFTCAQLHVEWYTSVFVLLVLMMLVSVAQRAAYTIITNRKSISFLQKICKLFWKFISSLAGKSVSLQSRHISSFFFFVVICGGVTADYFSWFRVQCNCGPRIYPSVDCSVFGRYFFFKYDKITRRGQFT